MNLGEILKTEVDCALISNRNYDSDNDFFADNINGVEKSLIARKYDPLGICKYIPFECASQNQSLAFVYKYEDDVYWCHIPKIYWFRILKEWYGYFEAKKIMNSILDSN